MVVMRTRCLAFAFLTAAIIMWWNSISNSTILLQTTLDNHYAISDVSSSNRTINTTTTSSENYLSRDAPKNCHRRCTHYKSKIFYDEPTDGGLDDRIRLINALSNLASFLCAELYLLPPSDLLQPYHNNNTRLDDDLLWSDLLQATRLYEHNIPPFVLHTQTYSSFQDKSKSHHGLRIVSTEWWKTNEDFKQIHNASFQNETFLWEIHISWWYMIAKQGGGLNNLGNIINDIIPKEIEREDYIDMLPTESKFPSIDLSPSWAFLADISHGCTYVKIEYSSPIKLMQRSLENEVRRQAPRQNNDDDSLIGLLHLRRGDTTQICDTSIEKVRSYLKCSIGGNEGLRSMMLVITSEEKDISYRNSILRLADEFIQLTLIDGDNITERIVDEAVATGQIPKSMANGFVVFAVESTLRTAESELIDFRLTRRRSNCPDCDPAIYQALDPKTKYSFEGGQLHVLH